ncbi:DUF6993 domain-containing protein [Arthrobacter sp. U41]|uniref:DUF6993 domain-containing protein n=1 Tax=Arthrobacter sp. U41 TaxID=1849032 RepID=UPI0021B67397|nr:hypothetical protein [Arthrobacter sp. U41]
MKRDRTIGHRAAPAPAKFGVLALALLLTVACSAPASSGARVEASPGAAAHAISPASRGASPAAATSDAKARVEAALNNVTAANRKPASEQLRSALIDAGFPTDSVEVTASRTPTGLDADAVEVAVTAGRTCIVAQLRNGRVTSSLLPPLADGRCLVGAAG